MRPAAQLRATVRRLERARRTLGRLDLAVASYHLGTAPLKHARSYASFYFRTSQQGPLVDYYWKVLAAERVMRLYRNDPAALRYEQHLQFKKNSAEEVLHPRTTTPQFRTPAAIASALRRHYLVHIPLDTKRTHIRVAVGDLAQRLGRSRRLYASLRPQALDVLLYIGREMRAYKPLLLTSAVRDDRYQRLLAAINPVATKAYSMHTTGYAFDLLRSFSSGAEKRAFFRILARLQAVNAIAYIPELAAMHIAVASDAPAKLALLRRLQ
jgi:hypothetical protein